MNIILPTLREERRKTYCPFYQSALKQKSVRNTIIRNRQEKWKAVFDNSGEKIETSILDGNSKLQWKVDWAMRWFF